MIRARTYEEIRIPHSLPQPIRDLPQESIAGGLAESIVLDALTGGMSNIAVPKYWDSKIEHPPPTEIDANLCEQSNREQLPDILRECRKKSEHRVQQNAVTHRW